MKTINMTHFIFLFMMITCININAQYSAYCDIVVRVWEKVCGFGGEIAMPVKTVTEIDSEITTAIFPEIFSAGKTQRIFMQLIIDTTGKVRCTKFLRKSNSGRIDSIANDYMHKLKFTSAVLHNGKKISMPFSMPIPLRIKVR